jgi:predicted dehydrogenase
MTKDTRKLRIGLVGAGRMGNVHAALLHNEPDVHIVAVCDLLPERAQKMADEWGGRAYTDYHEMLGAEELDAAYVCTPTYNHGEIALACVEKGLHLFVEKPLELDLGVAGRLVRAAESAGVIATVAFHWRYSQGYERAARLIGDDPIALVNLRWYWTRPPIPWMWDRHLAGGQIVDQNIHLVDLSQALAGDIEIVYAQYNQRQVNFEPNFDNWDGYAVTFRYKTGAVGNCAGTYGLFPEIQAGPSADFALRDRMVRVTDKGAALFTPGGVEEWLNEGPFHAGVNRVFIQALREQNPSLVRSTLRSGLRSTAAALAANHSAETGQPVNLDQFIAERAGVDP